MKITHIFIPGTYTDALSYQENMLTRVQKRLGHDVTLIVENKKLSETGAVVDTPVGTVDEDGVRVIRLCREKRTPLKKLDLLIEAFPVYEILSDIQPDIIFVHCLGHGVVNYDIIRYKRENKSCRIMTDTHEFDGVSRPYARTVEGYLSRKYYNHINKKLYKVCDKIFGITPDCIDFAIKYRCVPADHRIELLPLGYDPAIVDWNRRNEIREEFRRAHGIPDDMFLIAHGGKIIPRRRTDIAIKAIKALDDPKVKLVIFGAISDEVKVEVSRLIEENRDRVVFLGQLTQREYIELYLASDMAFFPGGQSVLWQEAIGCGLPLVLGKAKGIEYLDRGGNVRIVESEDESGFTAELKKLLSGEFGKIADAAKIAGREFFSYERISNLITGK